MLNLLPPQKNLWVPGGSFEEPKRKTQRYDSTDPKKLSEKRKKNRFTTYEESKKTYLYSASV